MPKLNLTGTDSLVDGRPAIAKLLGVHPEELRVTSGSAEGNNWAVKGIAFSNRSKGNHVITTKFERPSVLESCAWLENQGFKVTYLEGNSEGLITSEILTKTLTKQTLLASIRHASDVGALQDLETLGDLCRKNGTYLHSDATDSFGIAEIKPSHADLLTLPGFLWVRPGTKIMAWQHGERDIHTRVPPAKIPKNMKSLRQRLIDGILSFQGVELLGPMGEKRVANNASFIFKGIDQEALNSLLQKKFLVNPVPIHALNALSQANHAATLKIILPMSITEQEIDTIINTVRGALKKLP